MTRQELIDMLTNLGAEDLTSEMHPNKIGKKYLRLKIARGSYINFNFDYEHYPFVSVSGNRRHILKYFTFEQAQELVNKHFTHAKN